MRNPKDALVSAYHHLHNMPFINNKPMWDVAFARFMKGDGKLESKETCGQTRGLSEIR